MKKSLLWSLIVLLVVSVMATFSLAGCKEAEETVAADEEEAVAEETSEPDEESMIEEPVEEFTLYVISHREFSEALMELMDTLDDEFESAHPGVTVQRDFMTFTDWSKVSELRLTSDNPPDIFVANNGEAGMGLMVRSGLLLDLTPYAEEFGWFDKIDQGLLNSMSYTVDGKVFGEGNLYGMAPLSEEVGVYYNKQKFSEAGAKVPSTYEEFISLIEMFKEKGETPLMLGNIEGWPATHVFGEILFSLLDREDKQWRDDFVYVKNDIGFNRPETVQAAAEFVNWIEKGYFIDGFEGIAYTDSIAEFAGGKGVMYIGGTWIANTMKDFVDINNFGFFTVPPREDKDWKMVIGCLGTPSAIHANTLHPDVAAEYLDWQISSRAAELWEEFGNIPTVPDLSKLEEGTLLYDFSNEWTKMNENGAIGLYLDWATPTMLDTSIAAIQGLIAKEITPEEYVQNVDEDFQAFLAEKQLK